MAYWKRRFAFLRKSLVKPGSREYRPRLEMLEDRLQPSLTGLPVDAIEAHAVTGFHQMDFVAQSTVAGGVHDMLSVSSATYLTGTTGAATARGIALGQDGSTYQTGTITENGSEQGYVAKYDPSGKQVYLFKFQAVDVTAPDITFMNTEGHALAVDSVGNVYVAGTAIDASSLDHNAYTAKISADGSAIVWGDALDGPGNLTTGDGIAVKDPNHDGNGLAVMTGSLTLDDGTDHLYVVRWTTDGTSVVAGDAGFYYYYTFGQSDQGTHATAIALNNNSTTSAPGSLAYIAANVLANGSPIALAFQVTNGDAVQNGTWATAVRGSSSTDSVTFTAVAANPDDSSVFAGRDVSGSASSGFIAGYAADGSTLLSPTLLQNAASLNAITVDSAGNIYTTGAAANPASGGVYVAELDSSGDILSETQFGGTSTVDAGYGIVVSSSGSIWVVGDTTSASLSTDGTTLNGTQDGFLASITV